MSVINGLQYHEGVRAMWLAEKSGDLYHHPYDLGVYENLISVRTDSIAIPHVS
jgi:palmitoyltransferase ZDHHC3/7/25